MAKRKISTLPTWSQADDLILMKYWDERMPARVMSHYLGKSLSAIYKRASQLGLIARKTRKLEMLDLIPT